MFIKVGDYVINTDHVHTIRVGPEGEAVSVVVENVGLQGNLFESRRALHFFGDDARRVREFLRSNSPTRSLAVMEP